MVQTKREIPLISHEDEVTLYKNIFSKINLPLFCVRSIERTFGGRTFRRCVATLSFSFIVQKAQSIDAALFTRALITLGTRARGACAIMPQPAAQGAECESSSRDAFNHYPPKNPSRTKDSIPRHCYINSIFSLDPWDNSYTNRLRLFSATHLPHMPIKNYVYYESHKVVRKISPLNSNQIQLF